MRMPQHQFFGYTVHHIVKAEMAGFLFHARMQHHLHEHIAQFFLKERHVPGIDRLHRFVRLFNEIGTHRTVGLRPIPRTAIGGAKDRHNGQ